MDNNNNNNNINKYNLQNRIKWRRNINFYKNIKFLDINIWNKIFNVLFNRNINDINNDYLNISQLFVSC